MARWPDFFIVGAPRAGTTSLYYYLRAHPQIYLPLIKEPHFFNRISFQKDDITKRILHSLPASLVRDPKEYLALFEAATAEQTIGEASVSYLSDQTAPFGIKERNPESKIIIMLRHPVDRAYSFYLLLRRSERGLSPSFFAAVQEDFQYLAQEEGAGSIFIRPGFYHQHVSRYLRTFGPEQTRIYLDSDLSCDSHRVVRDICEFLSVPFCDGEFFDPGQQYNTYAAPRNRLFAWLAQNRAIWSSCQAALKMQPIPLASKMLFDTRHPKPPLDPKSREFLRSIYHDDILKLQELIGRDLGNWLAD